MDACVTSWSGAHCTNVDSLHDYSISPAPSGAFESISVGSYSACALDAGGRATCWGRGPTGTNDAPTEVRFRKLSVSFQFACGIDLEGAVHCWGVEYHGEMEERPGPYEDIATDDYGTCGKLASGRWECWGWEDSRLSTVPDVAMTRVNGMAGNFCGLSAAGEIHCWGRSQYGVTEPPGGSGFTDVAVGQRHACALDADGHIACWGDNGRGQCDAPGDTFVRVVTGSFYTCGVDSWAGLTCWGCYDGPCTTER